MAIEKKTTKYEILIRFNDEGVLQGAHVGELIQLVNDGVVEAATATTRPLSLEEATGGLWDVLSDVQAQALARVGVLTTEKAELQKEKAALEAEIRRPLKGA